MFTSYQKTDKIVLFLLKLAVSFLFCSCQYRFTNLHLNPPLGLNKIAVESIYDTSGIVVPHEHLWEAVQGAFASDGKMKLTSVNQADLILRIHLYQVQINQKNVNGRLIKEPKKIPSVLTKQPTALSRYTQLNVATLYSGAETVSISTKVEVWDLSSQKLLISRNYSASGSYKIIDTDIPTESRFLRAEESFDHLFMNLSRTIARSVVKDVLSFNAHL